jgi:phosphatidylserine/phosphatidylglycerophosphate/cardiolipin synthase-like enzyme
MSNPIVELASAITPAVAVKLASSLEIDGSITKALSALPDDSLMRELLKASHTILGADGLASVLRGFAAAGAANMTNIRAVWSGPTFNGDGDHTTAALAHLIDTAVEDVFASTYSATIDSDFVSALWRAVARGVRTTLLLDSKVNGGDVAAKLMTRLAGARFLTYIPPAGQYGLQHSKVLIVDSRIAFVTSANLSRAAAERNLEAGVVIHDAGFASQMRQRFVKLREAGEIVDLQQ